MKISKIFSMFFLIILVSCGIRNYDYYKFSKLEKRGFKLKIDSKDYSLSNTILDKENISEIKIDKKNKLVNIKTIQNPYFIDLKTISDSINDKDLNVAVMFGLPFMKEDFDKVLIEKSAIDSLNFIKVIAVPTSCNNSKALIIKIKQ
jgi:hypothetical protein